MERQAIPVAVDTELLRKTLQPISAELAADLLAVPLTIDSGKDLQRALARDRQAAERG